MTTATKKNDVATYKGRKYRLLWIGQTKFGRRAKLGYFDGSKEFWADAAAVSIRTSKQYGRGYSDDRCELCGKNKYTCGHCIGW